MMSSAAAAAAAATRHALTEEQRQQIIAKLLSERRSGQHVQRQPGSGAAASMGPEERAAKLQELISRRAAAKQQQASMAASYGHDALQDDSRGQQQQPQQQHRRQHHAVQPRPPPPQQQQQQQHYQHHHQQQQLQQSQRQHHHQHGVRSSATNSLHGLSVSQDPLLSPGSTASVMSVATTPAAGAAGGAGGKGHSHYHKQQQQPHLQHDRSPDLCSRQPRVPGQRTPLQQQPQQQPQRQQLNQRPQQLPPTQQQQRGGAVAPQHGSSRRPRDALLSDVLDGPVDISDLWAASRHTAGGGGVAGGAGAAAGLDNDTDLSATASAATTATEDSAAGSLHQHSSAADYTDDAHSQGASSEDSQGGGGHYHHLSHQQHQRAQLHEQDDYDDGDSILGSSCSPESGRGRRGLAAVGGRAAGVGASSDCWGALGSPEYAYQQQLGHHQGAYKYTHDDSHDDDDMLTNDDEHDNDMSDDDCDGDYGLQQQRAAAGAAGAGTTSQHGLRSSSSWQLSGSLALSPTARPPSQQRQQQQQSLAERQQRLMQLQQLHQQMQDKKRQQQGGGGGGSGSSTMRPQPPQPRRQQQQHFRQPSPPAQPRWEHHQQQQPQPLPASYPASRAERLQQLAQPKGANRQKYDQMRAEAEQQMLQQCSFAPRTGRGPQHRCAPSNLPASERLYKAAAEKKARLEHKAALAAASSMVEACTFQPVTNAAANARVLESYEYVPLHRRLGQVMRSRSEKLAHIQQQVEAEAAVTTTFAPRINPRSSLLASVRRSRSCSRLRGGYEGSGEGDEEEEQEEERRRGDRSLSPLPARGRGETGGGGGEGQRRAASCGRSRPLSGSSNRDQQGGGGDAGREQEQARDASRGRTRERGNNSSSLRRTWSASNLLSSSTTRGRSRPRPEDSACTFAPSINARSEALLQASGEIPLSFLQRQEYFDRLAREKKQLLQLAVEDQHCSFLPAAGTRSTSRSGRQPDGGALDDDDSSPYLDRIERLAYADKRRMDSSRSALAAHLHSTECTFAPAINPRSARMARATPLEELYANSKGRLRRDSVALALELQEQAECTFSPNLHKPGVRGGQQSPGPETQEVIASVVDRLYGSSDQQKSKEARLGEALSYQQYQELKACTFKPAINRDAPKHQGPVLVRGLGRFLELKGMAKQQAEAQAALEAKVFIAQPRMPAAPFTTPQPFRLGPVMPSGYEARRQRAVAEAEAAVMGECTFQPRINSHHKTRQQRVAELLGQQ